MKISKSSNKKLIPPGFLIIDIDRSNWLATIIYIFKNNPKFNKKEIKELLVLKDVAREVIKIFLTEKDIKSVLKNNPDLMEFFL